MGKSSTSSNGSANAATNGTSTTEIDPALMSRWTALYDRASAEADKPFQAYTMPTQGNDNSYYAAARAAVDNAQGAGLGQTGQASGVYGQIANQDPRYMQSGQIAGSDLSPYQNPWQQQVIDASLSDIKQQQDRSLNDINAGTPRGAFGGGRQGVSDALTREAYDRNAQSTVAGLRQQGFNTATGLRQQDIANSQFDNGLNAQIGQANTQARLAGAGGLLNAGAQQSNLQLGQAAALAGSGAQIKSAQDAIYGDQYREFLRQQGEGTNDIGLLGSAFGFTPSTANGSSTNTTGATNNNAKSSSKGFTS